MLEPISLDLMIDNMPYAVRAVPCVYNNELQYKVYIDNNEEVLFVFDAEIGHYVAVGKDGATIPDNVEAELGARLNSHSLKIRPNI